MAKNQLNVIRLSLVLRGARCCVCNAAFVGPEIMFIENLAVCRTCCDTTDRIELMDIASLVTCQCCIGDWTQIRGLCYWSPRSFEATNGTPRVRHMAQTHDAVTRQSLRDLVQMRDDA